MRRRGFIKGVVAVTVSFLAGCTEDDIQDSGDQDSGYGGNQEQASDTNLQFGETYRTPLGIEVTVSNPRFQDYIQYRGNVYEPDPGNKVLFIHVKTENTNSEEEWLPIGSDFIVRVNNSQYGTIFGTVTPDGYEGGDVLGGIVRDGNVAYGVPEDTEMQNIQIVLTENVDKPVTWELVN